MRASELTQTLGHPCEFQVQDFNHAPASIAVGVDHVRAVATAVELLSFGFPASIPGPAASRL